ncbi:hypothetical protein D1821_18420 (plasmid) [Phaeobacter inhibens]|nr:hypothetical protein D1821_18420 [Phaeobacter inhibens]
MPGGYAVATVSHRYRSRIPVLLIWWMPRMAPSFGQFGASMSSFHSIEAHLKIGKEIVWPNWTMVYLLGQSPKKTG